MTESRSNYTCLVVILTDFVLKKDEKEKKVIRHITDDL